MNIENLSMVAIAQVRPVLACRVLSDPGQAETLYAEWSDLCQRTFRNELTQSPDWLLTWWQTFGPADGRQLRLGLFHQGDRLIGLAPLLRRWYRYRGILPFRRLEFLGSGEPPEQGIYSNHLSVLAEAGCEDQVARALVRGIQDNVFGSWDEVVLPMMAADTPMPDLLAGAFRAAGFFVEMTEMARAPYIPLPETWDTYLHNLSANGRRNILRPLKALADGAGNTARLERVRHVSELDKGLSILTHLHHARWSSAGETGVFHLPAFLRFHQAIMHRLLDRNALLLSWLCIDHDPVAAFYGMEWSGKIYAYQIGRRTDMPGKLRPGATLLALLIRQAIAEGRKEFDLLADDAPYKQQLTSRTRTLVRLRAARPSLMESLRRVGKGSCNSFRWLGGLGN